MAKKVKTQAKKSKSRRSTSSAGRVTPTYMAKGESYTMGLHDVVRVLKVIEKHGHMAKFVRAAKAQRAAATFDAKTVNFVKDFMVKHKMHNDPIGKHIVNAAQAGPRTAMARGRSGRFNCDFGGESAGGRHGSGGGRPRLPFPGGPHGTGGGPDE